MADEGDDHPGEAVMSGHGYYNRHSVLQAAAAEVGFGALAEAAGQVPLDGAAAAVVVADYGCSQGQNSLRPMAVAVGALRRRTDGPLTVVHTDLPGNDFASVFEAVAHDPASYAAGDALVFALAAGRSFYGQVLPPASVALGWSSITTHWLSAVPCPVPGHLSPHLAADPAVRGAFAARAATDWAAFLDGRAAELITGGRLVMVEPCRHPDGLVGSEGQMQLMDEVLAELVAEGGVDAGVAAETTLPVWLRTPEEYLAPVEAHPDLEVVVGDVLESVPSPLWEDLERTGDAAAYAEASVGVMRGWSEAMLRTAMPDAAVRDDYYERCRQRGAADPERLHVRSFHLLLDARRR